MIKHGVIIRALLYMKQKISRIWFENNLELGSFYCASQRDEKPKKRANITVFHQIIIPSGTDPRI